LFNCIILIIICSLISLIIKVMSNIVSWKANRKIIGRYNKNSIICIISDWIHSKWHLIYHRSGPECIVIVKSSIIAKFTAFPPRISNHQNRYFGSICSKNIKNSQNRISVPLCNITNAAYCIFSFFWRCCHNIIFLICCKQGFKKWCVSLNSLVWKNWNSCYCLNTLISCTSISI